MVEQTPAHLVFFSPFTPQQDQNFPQQCQVSLTIWLWNMADDKDQQEKTANICQQMLAQHLGYQMAKSNPKWRSMGQNEESANRRSHEEEKTGLKPQSNITRQALDWNPQGKRNVGRPRKTWRRSIDAEMKAAGMTWAELKRTSLNCVRWRSIVAALCSRAEPED